MTNEPELLQPQRTKIINISFITTYTSSEHVHVVDPLEHLVVDVLLLGALPLQAALLIDICLQVFTTCKATFGIART